MISALRPGGGLAMALVAATAAAQQPATTVQLPTFSQFTVRTSVSVPDGGTALLGGVDRAFDSSVTRGFGPLRNRGLAGGRSASAVSARATIIDHAEIDRAILAAAAGRAAPLPTDSKAREIAAGLATAGANVNGKGSAALPGSVEAIRTANAAEDQERAEQVAAYLAEAERAEAAGKLGVAKVYYQMVVRSSSPHRQWAAQRLAALAKDASAKHAP